MTDEKLKQIRAAKLNALKYGRLYRRWNVERRRLEAEFRRATPPTPVAESGE